MVSNDNFDKYEVFTTVKVVSFWQGIVEACIHSETATRIQ